MSIKLGSIVVVDDNLEGCKKGEVIKFNVAANKCTVDMFNGDVWFGLLTSVQLDESIAEAVDDLMSM